MDYSIKEVAQRFGLTAPTLRYYEKEGLIPSVNRGENGRRRYCDADLEWISIICCMRSTGMSIDYIKRYIDLCYLGESTVADRREMILRQKEIIEGHIREYEKLLAVVNRKIEYYDAIQKQEGRTSSCGSGA